VRGPALAVLAIVLAACASRAEPENLLDREFAAYRADREERRVADLEARTAKAKAEADRLQAELDAALAEVEAKRVRLSDATRARLRLPDPIKVEGGVPAAPKAPSPVEGPAPSPPAEPTKAPAPR
jgi:hypothetical protein